MLRIRQHIKRTVFMKKIFGKVLKTEAAILTAVIIASACSIAGFAYRCSQVRESVLRMHVIANLIREPYKHKHGEDPNDYVALSIT